ncbi:hypothetical protein CDAR_203541 [Caerostris darwini]|uniref:Uncharacterized protein n=1 Tax=Caerostris darwini TaxID=1538125 RepID=A0AAV4TSQ7_9ARAC|nr:hypothetical protein CDAR_203541 [Caerostris darwini]
MEECGGIIAPTEREMSVWSFHSVFGGGDAELRCRIILSGGVKGWRSNKKRLGLQNLHRRHLICKGGIAPPSAPVSKLSHYPRWHCRLSNFLYPSVMKGAHLFIAILRGSQCVRPRLKGWRSAEGSVNPRKGEGGMFVVEFSLVFGGADAEWNYFIRRC